MAETPPPAPMPLFEAYISHKLGRGYIRPRPSIRVANIKVITRLSRVMISEDRVYIAETPPINGAYWHEIEFEGVRGYISEEHLEIQFVNPPPSEASTEQVLSVVIRGKPDYIQWLKDQLQNILAKL